MIVSWSTRGQRGGMSLCSASGRGGTEPSSASCSLASRTPCAISCAACPAVMPLPPLPSSVVASVNPAGIGSAFRQTLCPCNDGLADGVDEIRSAQFALGAKAGDDDRLRPGQLLPRIVGIDSWRS